LKEKPISSIEYSVTRLPYLTAGRSFHGSGERNIYIYIYIFFFFHLIFSSFFLWKVLVARAQYLLSVAELDEGCVPEITWTQQEKEYITTHSLKYSEDIM
jgi:hypothetical protein